MSEKSTNKLLGEKLKKEILKQGYSSVYQFWIHVAGEDFSRTTLNKIIQGKSDPKFSTLLKLSELLNISLSELVTFNNIEEEKQQ